MRKLFEFLHVLVYSFGLVLAMTVSIGVIYIVFNLIADWLRSF